MAQRGLAWSNMAQCGPVCAHVHMLTMAVLTEVKGWEGHNVLLGHSWYT